MNLIKLEKLGLNYEEGLHRFMGNEGLYNKFLVKFISNTDSEKLKQAIEKNDYKVAFFYAHSLKGIVGDLSLNTLFDDVCRVVEDVREDVKPTLKKDFKSYYKNYLNIIEALKEEE